jgi:hypothetical protein
MNKKAMRTMLMSFLLDPTQTSGFEVAKELGVYRNDWLGTVWNPLIKQRLVRRHEDDEPSGWKVTANGLRFLEEEENEETA